MKAATGVKVSVLVAWLLSAIAVLMLMFITDRYRGGYEDMVSDAGVLVFAGLVVALSAAIAAMLVRKKTPEALSGAWLAGVVVHVALTLLFLGGVFILARFST